MTHLLDSFRALLPGGPSFIETGASPGLEMFPLLMGLFGGLALFLFGMEQMATALKTVAGDRMKIILARLTSNRILGVLTGAFVTAVIQSSSVTTVLVVGFISAGLMTLVQSIGVILGADIGTTITAQIIAFKVTKYALLMVALGFGMVFIGKKETTRHRGKAIMGLGLVFFGMSVMGEAMAPLRDHSPFLEWMTRMENPALGILAGAVFTALIQSSSAMIGVVIVMASQGLVSLPAGISLVFGANIGTCVTALIASLGKPREAIRAAVVHIVFKIVGVLIWLAFIDQLAGLVTWMSPAAQELTGTDRLAAEAPRQIANAHTVFNVANTLIFLPFATQFARFVTWLVPDRPAEEDNRIRARYLDLSLLGTPALAIDRARLELLHLGDEILSMLRDIVPAVISGTRESLREIQRRDDTVDILHGQIIAYLGKVSQTALTDGQTAELLSLMETANDLENIGDLVETNLVGIGNRRLDEAVVISEATRVVIREFHAAVTLALENALLAVTQKNERAARTVIQMKKDVNRMSDSARLHHMRRLVAEEPNRLATFAVETDTIANLRRVYYFAKRMARGIAPPAVLAKN